MLSKMFSRRHTEIEFLFFQKTGFDIVCKLSPMAIICMKCMILFSGKYKKNIISFFSAEFVTRMVLVNVTVIHEFSS